MVKYVETYIGFSEVPEEITLCINIANCPHHCEGCHSPHLWKDEGEILYGDVLRDLIEANKGITCVAFMGGDKNIEQIVKLANMVRYCYKDLKVCWYRGINKLNFQSKYIKYFDYIKVGKYNKLKGGLDNPNTNQKMYRIFPGRLLNAYYCNVVDITHKFWIKNETDNKDKIIE